MGWVRRGRLFGPDDLPAWAASHAALPFAEPVEGNRFRLWFAGRDSANHGRIGHVELVLQDPPALGAFAERPVLAAGSPGAFDADGVTPSCLVRHDGRLFLYYTGWSLARSVPFHLFAGLAVSEDDGRTFRRISTAPILERNEVDPYLTASPWVLRDGDRWRMWYVSGVRWTLEADGPRHHYHVRYAESDDGIAWRRDGTVCLDFASESEYAFSRPCVLRDGDRYRMWFAVRGDSYRIGYAESTDGVAWTREDAAGGLPPPPAGRETWDGAMTCYPHVFNHAGRRWMLYNGNDYGKTGIGLATWEE